MLQLEARPQSLSGPDRIRTGASTLVSMRLQMRTGAHFARQCRTIQVANGPVPRLYSPAGTPCGVFFAVFGWITNFLFHNCRCNHHRLLCHLRAIFDAAVAAAHPTSVPRASATCAEGPRRSASQRAKARLRWRRRPNGIIHALGLDPVRLTGLATTRHGHGAPNAPDQGRRGRPSRARRSRAASRPEPTLGLAAEATADDLLLALLSAGGSAKLDRARRRRFVRAEAAGEPRLVAFGRADRRDEHRPQASVADQGRTTGPRRAARRRDRDAGDLRRAA